MHIKIRALIVTFTAVLSVAAGASADVVTQWNGAALDAIRTHAVTPPAASRSLAILHVAIYDTVNGITGRHESFHVRSRGLAGGSVAAAVSAAAYVVLKRLFPEDDDVLKALLAESLDPIPNGPGKWRGIAWGTWVADRILLWRANDNADAIVVAPSGTGPGLWQPTPPAFAPYLLPQWGWMTPFAIPTGSYFRPSGPPLLTSAEYARDYNEVKAFGVATGSLRTADQTEIALFWADGAGTETPPGHWNTIARHVGETLGNSIEQNARLLALLNVAMADAAICAWDAKYFFDFWRPITAIREGDADGNDATEADRNWTSLLVNPPFPDYVSGHSTFSGAASRVLARFYGSDAITFTTGSDALPGVSRTFQSFSSAAEEAMVSRVLAGIHFKTAGLDGLEAGQQIGDWTWQHTMRRITHRDHTDGDGDEDSPGVGRPPNQHR